MSKAIAKRILSPPRRHSRGKSRPRRPRRPSQLGMAHVRFMRVYPDGRLADNVVDLTLPRGTKLQTLSVFHPALTYASAAGRLLSGSCAFPAGQHTVLVSRSHS